jgi:hypothetical protein
MLVDTQHSAPNSRASSPPSANVVETRTTPRFPTPLNCESRPGALGALSLAPLTRKRSKVARSATVLPPLLDADRDPFEEKCADW